MPTWRCREPKDLSYVLDNLSELVVKEVQGSGGYGMLVGPASSQAEIEALQTTHSGGTRQIYCPADTGIVILPDSGGIRRCATPCRFETVRIVRQGSAFVPGGLTRVALNEGSLVVNSSQGGGTKDTWVLED